MGNKANKNGISSFHMLLGTFCIAYSIGVALRLYIPELNSGEVRIGGFCWLVFYIAVIFIVSKIMRFLIDVIPNIIASYMLLIGCCEGVACVAMCSYLIKLPWYSYSVGAIGGSLVGVAIVFFLYSDRGVDHLLSNTVGNIISGIFGGIIIAWIITPVLFPNGATESAGNMPLICFGIAVVSMIPSYIILSFFVKRCTAQSQMKFEDERRQIMRDQDLYTERCAKGKAEQEARTKAEQERARKERERQERERNERARKEQEERRRRHNQQYGSNNRSSSSTGGTSRNHSGSWNNNVESYFKGCSNKAELKRRYRQLCKKLHPDCPGGNAESFRRMKSEYEGFYNACIL